MILHSTPASATSNNITFLISLYRGHFAILGEAVRAVRGAGAGRDRRDAGEQRRARVVRSRIRDRRT